MSNQKRIGLEGAIKAYAGCSRIIATIQRASSTELSGEGQAVLCVQTAKKPPVSLTQNQPPKTGKGRRMTYAITSAEWVGHADASMGPHAG